MNVRKPFSQLLILSLMVSTFTVTPLLCIGQVSPKTDSISVQIADFRGKGYDYAGVAAFSSSKKNVVVVMVCGADQDIIDATENGIKGLIREGYPRVAMIISDPDPTPEDNPMVTIFADGDYHYYMTGVSVIAQYEFHLYESVKDAYKQFILSPSKD